MHQHTASCCLLLLLCAVGAAAWTPTVSDRLFYQLGKRFNLKTDVKKGVRVYVVDGFDTPASVVKAMRKRKLVPVCYFSAGTSEDWRPDFKKIPKKAIGKVVKISDGGGDTWTGENWLDIRSATMRNLTASRIRMCKAKGFLGVDPDNMDGYANDSGFPLKAGHQLAFNRFVAATAHAHGLAVGLKNDGDQIPQLVGDFDFAVNEQCWEMGECSQYAPFIKAKKPVYNIEYEGSAKQFKRTICPAAAKLGIQTSKHKLELDAWWLPC